MLIEAHSCKYNLFQLIIGFILCVIILLWQNHFLSGTFNFFCIFILGCFFLLTLKMDKLSAVRNHQRLNGFNVQKIY